MFILKNFSTCFGHHYAHLQENKTYVTACGVLRYQPHPAEPAQHTTCSNIRLVLLKMGIMMPETCWEIVENKHLTVVSCWFSLSLLNLLTMHGHRNLKHPNLHNRRSSTQSDINQVSHGYSHFPDDGHMTAPNMWRIEINIQEKIVRYYLQGTLTQFCNTCTKCVEL